MSNHQEVADTQNNIGGKIAINYLIGYVLSAILIVAAFLLVYKHVVTTHALYISLTILIAAQLFVQMRFFVRWNAAEDKDRWNLMSLLFTILVLFIVVCGSLWIMYNLNYNMVH